MALSFRPVTVKGGWMESQETLVQHKKVKGNEKLGCRQCQTPVEEEQTQQHFFQTPWGTCSGHMKGVDKDSSRMLDTSPVFRRSEFTEYSAKTTGREGNGRKDGKTRAGFRVPRV